MEGDREALHAFFIACAYGMTALAILVELVALRRRRRRARQIAVDFDASEAPAVAIQATRGSHEIPA